MSNPLSERPSRRSVRAQLSVAIRVTSPGCSEVKKGLLRDISAYGAFVYTDFSPELGTQIAIDFIMPGTTTDTRFLCEGIVVRVEKASKGSCTGVAMQITKLDLAA